jgi:serine/threonine protein kinase
LHCARFQADPGSADRIHSESRGAEIQRALCEIDDRVPRVFDTFVSDAGWFYVEMEFVDGEDLAAVIERGPLPVAEAVRIAREVFDFLRIAHSTPVSVDGERREQQLHGDLAPKNIRLTRDGAVKILDFGIAKGLQATATAVMFGSYGYISPERLRTGRMGTSDDFWSAGVGALRDARRPPCLQRQQRGDRTRPQRAPATAAAGRSDSTRRSIDRLETAGMGSRISLSGRHDGPR